MSCLGKQEFVEGVGLRVNVEFQDLPRSSPLTETVWGSAYTGLLTPKLLVSPPTTVPFHRPIRPPGTTQGCSSPGGEDWLLALIPDQPQNTQNKSLGRLKQ